MYSPPASPSSSRGYKRGQWKVCLNAGLLLVAMGWILGLASQSRSLSLEGVSLPDHLGHFQSPPAPQPIIIEDGIKPRKSLSMIVTNDTTSSDVAATRKANDLAVERNVTTVYNNTTALHENSEKQLHPKESWRVVLSHDRPYNRLAPHIDVVWTRGWYNVYMPPPTVPIGYYNELTSGRI